MASCSKCGSSDVTYKEGVSKKNGKEYKGYKCNACPNMDFLNQGFTPPKFPDQPKPVPQQAPAPQAAPRPTGFSRTNALTLATHLLVAEVNARKDLVSPLRYKELIDMVSNAYNNKFEVDLNEL